MTTLDFLGLHNGDIENISEHLEKELERIGLDDKEIDDIYNDMKFSLSFFFTWEDATNSLIRCLFSCAESYINNKFPGKYDVCYEVNGWASSFEVKAVKKRKTA